ncbi:MAG: hypothetical protein KGH75_08280 [Rhodospirillales bacterium]|nr:hypothetical protein [Rhodospirillales bacterium]
MKRAIILARPELKRAVILAVLALAGCANAPQIPQTITVAKTRYMQWAWPGGLQSCASDPGPLAIPHIVATDPHASSQVAAYIARLRAHDADAVGVADECRDTLAAALAANKGAQ